jgi:hypothetical protein
MAVVTAAKESKKRPRKGHEGEAEMSRRRRRKVSKEDETQVELQQAPTQECIVVDVRQRERSPSCHIIRLKINVKTPSKTAPMSSRSRWHFHLHTSNLASPTIPSLRSTTSNSTLRHQRASTQAPNTKHQAAIHQQQWHAHAPTAATHARANMAAVPLHPRLHPRAPRLRWRHHRLRTDGLGAFDRGGPHRGRPGASHPHPSLLPRRGRR